MIVAGLSNEEFASTLRAIPYPFPQDGQRGAAIEIWHGAHGQYETNAPVRTFIAYDFDGEPEILASYTCTPLVRIPGRQADPGAKVMGMTIAELGNMNRPLDMIAYRKDGSDHILMANSNRGVMKLDANNLGDYGAITEKIAATRGGPYETIGDLQGVRRLDRLGDGHALAMVANGEVLEPHHHRPALMGASAGALASRGPPRASAPSALDSAEALAEGWAAVFALYAGGDSSTPPMLGRYAQDGAAIVFTPRFAPAPSLRLRAQFHPPHATPVTAWFGGVPSPPRAPTTRVVAVTPSADVWPENILRFYVTFSAPMRLGVAWDNIRMLGADGAPMGGMFVEVDPELWDPEGRRMTVLFDPARIKRGLVDNINEGPPLSIGETCTLEIDHTWRDAAGSLLVEALRQDDPGRPADPRRARSGRLAPDAARHARRAAHSGFSASPGRRAGPARLHGDARPGRDRLRSGARSWMRRASS